ncbi:MAG: ABC transporter ATP-binding protein/permease [Lachnospiraceae bacterium]|nr:ABC transporter ATP-binding protein/permease [Lachnospiraceae bacterium]
MLKKINYILDRGQKQRLFLLGIAIMIGAFWETVSISAVLPLVNVVTDPTVIETNKYFRFIRDFFHIPDTRTYIFVMAMFMIAVYMIKNFYLIFLYNLQFRYTTNNQRRISYKLMQCYLSQDYLFHVSHNVAELQRNCSSDVGNFFSVILNLIQLVTEVMTVTFLVILLLMQDVGTTLVILGIMLVFLFLVLVVFKRILVDIGAKKRVIGAEMNKWFLQSFGGIKEIKVANREQYFLDHYDANYRKSVKLSKKSMLISIIPRPTMETLVICGMLVYIAIRILMGEDIKSFVPILSVFIVAAVRMLPSFNRISGCFSMIMGSKSSIDSVYQDLHDIEGLRLEVERDNQDQTVITIDNGIHLDRVRFYYPAKPDAIILQDVTFDIPKNVSVAFIGPSGAGKTTLADVILGVLKPQGGHVYADGIDIYEHLHAWHKKVGYIPQNIYLMDDTVRANVAFGYSKEDTNDEQVWKALREAQLEEIFRNSEKGLDTNIGAMGVKLSGGQRQRIGIARALYLEPEILILDEATSALDTETETAVMESIDNLAGTKTMIIIAHRITTIRNCDIVYEVRDGEIHERNKEEVLREAFDLTQSE